MKMIGANQNRTSVVMRPCAKPGLSLYSVLAQLVTELLPVSDVQENLRIVEPTRKNSLILQSSISGYREIL